MSVIIDLAGWRLTLRSHERAGQPLLMGYPAQAPQESAPLTLGGVRTSSANGSCGYRQGDVATHASSTSRPSTDGWPELWACSLRGRATTMGRCSGCSKSAFVQLHRTPSFSACPTAHAHLPTLNGSSPVINSMCALSHPAPRCRAGHRRGHDRQRRPGPHSAGRRLIDLSNAHGGRGQE